MGILCRSMVIYVNLKLSVTIIVLAPIFDYIVSGTALSSRHSVLVAMREASSLSPTTPSERQIRPQACSTIVESKHSEYNPQEYRQRKQ